MEHVRLELNESAGTSCCKDPAAPNQSASLYVFTVVHICKHSEKWVHTNTQKHTPCTHWQEEAAEAGTTGPAAFNKKNTQTMSVTRIMNINCA